MNAADLRKDAARRRALARAATQGPWVRLPKTGQVRAKRYGWPPIFVADCYADDEGTVTAKHIAANDPAAALASCERDELLADAMDLLSHGASSGNGFAHELLRRFAALGEGK